MASPHNPPRTKCKKRRFASQEAAEDGLEQVRVLNFSKGRESRNKRLHTYFCDECGYFHIGHKRR